MKLLYHICILFALSLVPLTISSCVGGGGGGGGNDEENGNQENSFAPSSLRGKTLSFSHSALERNYKGEPVVNKYYTEMEFLGKNEVYYKMRQNEHIEQLVGTTKWTDLYEGTYTYNRTDGETATLTYRAGQYSATLTMRFIDSYGGTARYKLLESSGEDTVNFFIK